jgi:hypothetical protein
MGLFGSCLGGVVFLWVLGSLGFLLAFSYILLIY